SFPTRRSSDLEKVVRAADFLLLHGDPQKLVDMVDKTRKVPGYRPMPILFIEDGHSGFDQSLNNMLPAVKTYCSCGYFDPHPHGYQTVPVNWSIDTGRKRAFFDEVKSITNEFEPFPP